MPSSCGGLPAEQLLEHRPDPRRPAAGSRAGRQSTGTTRVDRHDPVQQRGHDPRARWESARCRSPLLEVRPAQHDLGALPSGLRIAVTLPVTAQSPNETSTLVRARTFWIDLEVLLVGDRPFDQDDIHVLGDTP